MEIGEQLKISEGAVKASLRLLFDKVNVKSRTQLVKVALEQYQDLCQFPEEKAARIARTLVERRDWLRAQGIHYVLMIPPEKSSIYPEKLPSRIHRFGLPSCLDQFLAYLEGRGSAWGRELASVHGDDLYWLWAFRIAYPVGWLYQDKVWVYRFYEQRSDVFKALATANRGRWKNELRSATDPALLIMVAPRLMEVFHDGAPG